ncbi:MAG TPA: TlpA disulfide reductase family protein [Aggregatilineales bacterium]|nr:TlpA disulfide reductase family protein [Aggregatilineales bacterium]
MTENLLNELEPTPADAPKRGIGMGGIVLLVGVVAVAAVFGLALIDRNAGQPTSGPAPDFTLTTLDGQDVRLSDLRGQVVVINFWASWCVPCRDEAPALQAVWERYRDRGVVLLGVAWTDTERNARAFIDEFSQNYPNGLDLGTRIGELYGITGVPETFIIDQQGQVVGFYPIALQQDQLAAVIESVLAGGGGT